MATNRIYQVLSILTTVVNCNNIRISSNTDSACINNCIDVGRIFCPANDMMDGWCCDAADGCYPGETRLAPMCSDSTSLHTLKYFTCPINPNCGRSKELVAQDEPRIKFVDPEDNELTFGDICSYQLKLEDYEDGEVLELSDLTTKNF